MSAKNWLLVAMATALAVVYVIYFTDWFKPKTVEIFHTVRNLRSRGGAARGSGPSPLLFGINRQLRLTEIKVLRAEEAETNAHAVPIWHLVTDSNSVPVKEFRYGQFIGGMKPAVKGTRPMLLDTNVAYRLLITAGDVTGRHDFELK